ncbi:uncharacterized protein C8R40DRAFT_1071925 [Lentinula edodes]|uniref:uncharacterized protein n=1 Tax=Lentinula edodes TaxID=5353 RepID=UPI001E8C9E36|nr:uncharacterized protein C8R40DRAFT_1071925 [Lentinula edodes]KAH7872142.1 hypothetical protein C8R40DRAFT_1071925 [Lentinula edodes]
MDLPSTQSITGSPSPSMPSPGHPTPLTSLAPLARSQAQNTSPNTGASVTSSHQNAPTATTTRQPDIPIPTTNVCSLQRQYSRTFSTVTASPKGKEPAEPRPQACSSSSPAIEPAEKEAFESLNLTPPPPSETATQARNRTNDNVARLAVLIHHMRQGAESKRRLVVDNMQDLAAVQASLREAFDTCMNESGMCSDVPVSQAPTMPPTLAVFDEWKDMHEAVRTIMEVNREHSNTMNLLQLQMGEVRDRVPELEKEIAELHGRLSQATLHSPPPPPQPLPPLASNLIPAASLFTSPYSAMPKHATVDFAQPAAKRARHDPAYTDVLVEGVKSDEGTASLVRKILNATNTAFPTVIAGYRMNDPGLPPHVVIRFKAADSASQFVWIVTERCPRGLQGCRVSLMQRPSPQSTHSYEFLQPKNSGVGNQQSIRAPGYGPPDDISGLGSGPMGW